MTQGERRKLLVSTELCELDGLSSYKHTVGYFGRVIDDDTLGVLARFLWRISEPQWCPLVCFYVDDEKRWRATVPSGWTTLLEKPERQREETLKLLWIVGKARDAESLVTVYRFAWNSDWANEPIVGVVAPIEDNGEFLASREEGPGLYPAEEHQLLYSYGTVVTRYHDGLWLNVWSKSLNSDSVLRELRGAVLTEDLCFEPIERAAWPRRPGN